jgi:hypothetical protein
MIALLFDIGLTTFLHGKIIFFDIVTMNGLKNLQKNIFLFGNLTD